MASANVENQFQREEFTEYCTKNELELLERESRVFKIIVNIFDAYRTEGWRSEKFKASFKAILWKLLAPSTVVFTTASIAGIFTLVLTWRTTTLLEQQNTLLRIQNHIQESTRRSGLTVELTEVLNHVALNKSEIEIDGNIEYKDGVPQCPSKTHGSTRSTHDFLARITLGRLVALTKAFQPYKFLDIDRDSLGRDPDTSLSSNSSPERAHLLTVLVAANVSLKQISTAGGTFAYSPLANTQFSGHDLSYVDLQNSDLNGAILKKSTFNMAKLNGSRLVEVNADCTIFDKAELTGSDLADGQFNKASFVGADLRHSRVQIAKFSGADLSGANLTGVYTCVDENIKYIGSFVEFLEELGLERSQIIVDSNTKFGLPNTTEGNGWCRHKSN